ncbi:MAG: TonB-dependent receptor [Sphingobacteriales bacterium]|nr:TonB-dependent receptor [Sphingobacteriales bacterium]
MKKRETVAVSQNGLFYLKIARIMKLTVAFLLIACLKVSAEGWGQEKITLKMNAAEIKKVLFAIEKKTEYRFLFAEASVKDKPKVNVDVHEATLPEVLDRILANTGIAYKLLGTNLVVLKEGVSGEIIAQEIKITGRVTSASGEPLAGASVFVKGSRTGTVTDANGNFSITVPDDAVLVISSVGYESAEVSVKGKTEVNVSLRLSERVQDAVVVIGYGTASKRDLTGSIVKLSGKDVADKPNVNPVASLQGKVAGVSIVNSGTPGQEPDIRIRGTNSLSPGGARPLYLVDGIFNDNINFLNPNDIESIEILKDPSSLAIFGVRGANGVIAVTTKKAKSGQISINFNSTFSSKKLVDKIEMVNASEFKTLFEEEEDNLGITGPSRFDFTPWTGNTDWIDEMTRSGMAFTNNLSLSAATDKNKFYFGVGQTYEEGIIRHEQLKRITLNLNDEVKLSKGIKFGFTLNAVRQRNPYGSAKGLLFNARRIWPVTPVYDNAHAAYYNLAFQAGQMVNPVWELNDNWDKELVYENRMVGSIYADISFLKYLNLRSTFYADMSNVDGRTYRPIDSLYDPISNTVFVHPSYNRTAVSQSNQRWNKFQQDHILTFRKNFNDHGVTAIAGFTTYYNDYRGLSGSVKQSLTGDPIPNDKRFWYIDNGFGDKATRESSSGQFERTTVSTLVRLLYNYKGKYLLNGSFRRDWSSAFRPDYGNQGQNFYSVGAAWEISKEDFFKNQKIFDYLKLKGSLGVLGGQNTYGFDYPAYPALKTSGSAVFGSLIVPVFAETYLADRNLHWETVHGKEIGIEFDALKRKLHGEIVYYHKTTKDIMALVSSGAGQSTLTNIGNMRNKGFEFSAGYTHNLTQDLVMTVSGNLTTYDNLFLESPFTSNPDEQYPSRTVAGFPIGYFYGYVVEGIYQTYADKLASPVMNLGSSYGPGDLKYKDLNGDGVVNTDDRMMIGNPTPDFTYGGSIALKYKGFDLGVDMQGVYGNEIYRYWGSSELPYTKFNYPKFKLNRWHGEGTSNWDPILGDNHTTNRLPSTYGIEDGSYFRIRNLQLGYNFNPAMLSKLHIKSLRVFINIQNLKTWKHNSGYSPEFGGSPTSFGVDVGHDPIPRIFSGGINVNF